MATSGWLMIGVKAVPPIPPSDDIVMQPPIIALIGKPLSRACALSAASSAASVTRSLVSTSRSTGTSRPSGPSTAIPMLKYFLSTKALPSSDSEELNVGNAPSPAARALTRKINGEILTSPPSALRCASSAVTSISSWWVTWGISVQLRASRRETTFWKLLSGAVSMAPNGVNWSSNFGSVIVIFPARGATGVGSGASIATLAHIRPNHLYLKLKA